MSYHARPMPALSPAIQPHHFPLVPLAQVPPPAPAMSEATKRTLIIIGILLFALIVLTMMSQKKEAVRRNPAKRLSTPELAKQLYERLERRGRANEGTLRSLKAYASKR